ncbi:hypothetical protein G7Y89_g7021 [Cudoniella acicularis]|uniref:2EXR domain-containing protein n=1 Tax=Cudoniella acicularis TaxID=354080 RepID=A0A8H4W477_9HELO|nr:hypothetical protein G7Y89_g7021 [Cudoniella acicularis]
MPLPKGRCPNDTGNVKCTKFPIFGRLPPELRRMVWKAACFHQRNVDITASYLRHQLYYNWDESYYFDVYYYLSLSSPPAVLQVNKESRSEGLKWYSLDFGTQPTISDPKYSSPAHVYINWKVDRICLLNRGLLRSVHDYAGIDFQERCTRNKLRFLACNLSDDVSHQCLQELMPRGLLLEELALFNSAVSQYASPRPLSLRLEDRRMNQIGAFKDFIDAVMADRERRESEMLQAPEIVSMGSDQVCSTAVDPLVVKLVRLLY